MEQIIQRYYEKWASTIQPDRIFKWGALAETSGSTAVLVEKAFKDMDDSEKLRQFEFRVFNILDEYFSNK